MSEMSFEKFFGRSALLLVLGLSAFSVSAEEKEEFYVGLDAYYLLNSLGNSATGKAEFDLAGAGFRAGMYIEPQLGLELYAAQGVNEAEDIGIDINVESIAGILGRFESPEAENGGKLYILLGYGMSELEMKRSASSLADRELYHGFVYGGGAEFRLGETNSFINIQGLRYYDEDDISLDGVSLGLRYGF